MEETKREIDVEYNADFVIKQNAQMLFQLDQLIGAVRGSRSSREISLVITKLEEGRMWLEANMRRLGGL